MLPRASSRVEDWVQEADPAAVPATAGSLRALPASTVEDWVQGPREQQREQSAEDAWSTAESVSSPTQPEDDDAPAPDTEGKERRERPVFRRELHGLRALALILVAVYHIWLGRVSGGVDVFLFLSAFFLTGTFLRRLDAGRPLSVPRYWLHVFKRLLPPAALTIVATLAASLWLLPSSLWPTIMQQAAASALYVQNALLVVQEVDYQARDAGAASPLQHFWSLSVQGQAFLVWPLLFVLVAPFARRGHRYRWPLLGIVLVIFAASLTWSVLSTAAQQPIAYFDTAARMWEFAAGALLALVLPRIDRLTRARRPEHDQPPSLRTGRALLGWLGIAALLACGVLVDVSGQFPGWIALWPLAAAGAVVVAGHSGRRWGVDRLLSSRPAAFLGDISYALYLVHWPILVIWLHHSGQERAGLLDGLAVLAGSILLAWLLTRAVDAPVRRSRWLEARPWRALTAVAASVMLVLAASGGWWLALTRGEPERPVASASPVVPTDDVATETARAIRPAGWQLGSQWPDLPERCAGPWAPTGPHKNVNCQQLLPSDSTPTGTIVVVGSSHARQHIPALIPYAQDNGLQIVNLTMDGCEFLPGTERWPYCEGYDEYALAYLDQVQPSAVLTTLTRTRPDSAGEVMPEGTQGAVQMVLDRGIDVIGVRDTPRWERDQYECAERVIDAGRPASAADAVCGADVEEKLARTDPAASLAGMRAQGPSDAPAAEAAELIMVDATEQVCPDGRCSPVLGDTFVYLDDNHLTRLFVETALAPMMREELESAAG